MYTHRKQIQYPARHSTCMSGNRYLLVDLSGILAGVLRVMASGGGGGCLASLTSSWLLDLLLALGALRSCSKFVIDAAFSFLSLCNKSWCLSYLRMCLYVNILGSRLGALRVYAASPGRTTGDVTSAPLAGDGAR